MNKTEVEKEEQEAEKGAEEWLDKEGERYLKKLEYDRRYQKLRRARKK